MSKASDLGLPDTVSILLRESDVHAEELPKGKVFVIYSGSGNPEEEHKISIIFESEAFGAKSWHRIG